jgi:hypothetical protein
VIASASTAKYSSEASDVRAIGNELGAPHVMEGSLRQAGIKLRLAVQLVDAVSGAHRWAETYARTLQPGKLFSNFRMISFPELSRRSPINTAYFRALCVRHSAGAKMPLRRTRPSYPPFAISHASPPTNRRLFERFSNAPFARFRITLIAC